MSGKLFKKYYQRIAREGFIKALLCGLSVGFGVLLLSSAIMWFVNEKLFWLAIILFAVTSALSVWLFYIKVFKPTTKKIAMRVDALGLEERVLTMTELEGDQSFIAMRQREDTLAALKTVNASMLSVIVSVPLIIVTCLMGVFGVGMTTVAALSASGVIKSGKDIIDDVTAPPIVTYEVTYEVKGDGGIIEGEIFQVVEAGQTAMPVMAVADDGWAFLEWSDGNGDPYHILENVTEDVTIYAVFEEIVDGDDGEGVGGGDEASDLPKDDGGGGQGTGAGPGVGGEYVPSNQVIDGETYYGKEYAIAFEDMIERLSQNAELPKELRDLISSYFETIRVTVDEEEKKTNN